MTTAHDSRPWYAIRAWETNLLLGAIGFTLLLFTRQLISEFGHYSIGFSGVSGWSVILYLMAVGVVLTMPVNRWTFGIILTFAILCRLVLLQPEPAMSSDIYRYAWDGVVQHHHISPYRYVPGDPALTFLREPNQDLFDNINRRDYAHTIYPPGAQILFYLISFIDPTVTGMKLAMIAMEGLTMFGLVRILQHLGLRREQSLLYAWCPLVIWEIGSSGHIDSAVMAFVTLAILARLCLRPVGTGLALGMAVLIKFYPLVLFPALFRRRDWKMPVAMVTLAAVCYSFYLSVGKGVFGFLGGYVKEEGVDSGTRFFFLELAHHVPGLAHLPNAVFFLFAALVLGSITLYCWLRYGLGRATASAAFLEGVVALALATMLLFSPHYPWYVVWLVPLFAVLPNLPLLAYFAGLFYLCSTSLGAGTIDAQFTLNRILYGAVAVACLAEFALRRWRPLPLPPPMRRAPAA